MYILKVILDKSRVKCIEVKIFWVLIVFGFIEKYGKSRENID